MDLRAGSPAAERRTWSRSLRGPILAGPASSCAHDHDCLRLPPVLSAQNSETGKKESAGHRLNRHCRPYAEPSSNSSLGYHRNDAHTAENGFAASSGMSESAKVVLGRVLITRRSQRRFLQASDVVSSKKQQLTELCLTTDADGRCDSSSRWQKHTLTD